MYVFIRYHAPHFELYMQASLFSDRCVSEPWARDHGDVSVRSKCPQASFWIDAMLAILAFCLL